MAGSANEFKEKVNAAARGRWGEIISSVCGIDPRCFEGKNGNPCPKCGGKNRFFLHTDFHDRGGAGCRACKNEKNHDAYAVIEWLKGYDFSKSLNLVADYLGIPRQKRATKGPATEIEPLNEGLAGLFTLNKKPISLEAIQSIGAKSGRHRIKDKSYPVICLPIQRPERTEKDWQLYAISGALPTMQGEAKAKANPGSKKGLLGDCLDRVKSSSVVWLTEGGTDALALKSQADLPEGHSVLSISSGAGSKLDPWMIDLLRDKTVYVVYDFDANGAGQSGSAKVLNSLAGIAASAKEIRLVESLPEGRAKIDLRDWLNDGHTAADLIRMAQEAPEWTPTQEEAPESKPRGPRIRIPGSPAEIYSIEAESGRTDAANAFRFVSSFGEEIAFVPQSKTWLSWDGRRWADDCGIGVMRSAKEYAESLWLDLAELAKKYDREELGVFQSFCKAVNQTGKIQSFVKLAESDQRITFSNESLNQHPTRLNVLNGTVDLDTGELLPHNPADRITQLAQVNYNPEATCPEWEKAILLIFGGDLELVRFVRQLLGYSCSGLTIEEVLILCWGHGCNGKSTVWNTIGTILGDYHRAASQDLILPERSQHPEILAALVGKRFVTISEPEAGRELRESTAKMLSSTDKIEAREMFGKRMAFTPTHKIWIPTNHRPKIKGTDEGIWRRIKMIPFAVDLRTVTKPRKGFHDWLVANEGPGILNWLIAGFRDWRANGLTEPQAVRAASESYRSESDSLGVFLREYCFEDPEASITATELFEVYSTEYGGKWSKTALGRAMGERYEKSKVWERETRGKVVYKGVRLLKEGDKIPGKSVDATSCNQSARPSLGSCANSIDTSDKPVATSCKSEIAAKPCPKCGRPMERCPVQQGTRWILDCPDCNYSEYDEPATAPELETANS